MNLSRGIFFENHISKKIDGKTFIIFTQRAQREKSSSTKYLQEDLTQRRGGAKDAKVMYESSLLLKIYDINTNNVVNDSQTNKNLASSAPLREVFL